MESSARVSSNTVLLADGTLVEILTFKTYLEMISASSLVLSVGQGAYSSVQITRNLNREFLLLLAKIRVC